MRSSLSLIAVVGLMICSAASCNKKPDPGPGSGGTPVVLDTNYAPVDPAIASSMGFFLDDWTPKTFTPPDFTSGPPAVGAPTDTISIDMNAVVTKVPRSIFGNNANQWMGQIVSQSNLMGYLKDLNPGVIRFPGGSVSDVYFWNSPVNSPPSDVATTMFDTNLQPVSVNNTNYWVGTNTAGWTISLENYYNLLQQTGSTGMVTVNYGYARYGKGPTPVATAAHLAADWVRHDQGKTKYWEIGNESGGAWEAGYKINLADNQDGQPEIITGALYGQHFKVFADSMRKAAQEVGVEIKIGAQVIGVDPINSYNPGDKVWNSGLFASIGDYADFFIVHDYYTAYHTNSTPTEILKTATTETDAIHSYLTTNTALNAVSMKPIAMTEYNIESQGSKQKVSNVAGMHAVLTLGEVLNQKFGMVGRWDLANGWDNGDDHGLFSNSAGSGAEPDAAAWNPRPAFYHLYYLQKCIGDRLVATRVSSVGGSTDIAAFSSSFSSGEAGSVIVNKGILPRTAMVNVNHFNPGSRVYWYVLTPGTDNGVFSGQVSVNGTAPSGATGGPLSYPTIKAYSSEITSGSLMVPVPANGVVYLVVDKN